MSARVMFRQLDTKAPLGKEKHHGNKRRSVARLKRIARRTDRAQNSQALYREIEQ